jgi:hypothetical protein
VGPGDLELERLAGREELTEIVGVTEGCADTLGAAELDALLVKLILWLLETEEDTEGSLVTDFD